jgi:hypothetical protein
MQHVHLGLERAEEEARRMVAPLVVWQMRNLWSPQMRASVKTAADGLLKSLSADEIVELCEVLMRFNNRCKEDSRAKCLAHGCRVDGKTLTVNSARTIRFTRSSAVG